MAAPPGAPAKGPNRRLRLFLALGAGILTLLCLGGVGVFISVYDEATQIKREAPDAVVDSYLRAYLVDRDDDETSLYTCKSGGDFAAIQAYRAEILDVETTNSTSVQVSWEGLRVSAPGRQGSVDVDLTRSIGSREKVTDAWRIAVVDQDGWRVCGATRMG